MNDADRPGGAAAFLGRCVAEGRMPGATWHVADGRGVVGRGAVGDSSIVPVREPASEDTIYDLASLTKPLATALLALLAARAGRLDLDEPLTRRLPEFSASPYAEVTLLELGAHRAGLPAWRPLYLRATDRRSYLAAIVAEPPAGRRGTELYSDLGYLALGIAIERALDGDLATLFRERIARPLGLSRTGFAVPPGPWSGAAPTEDGNRYERRLAGESGRSYDGWRVGPIRGAVHDGNAYGLGGVAGHAGLFGTAAEVARIAREGIEPGELGLAPACRDRWLRPVGGRGLRTFGWVTAAGSSAARGVLPEDAVGHVGFTGTSAWVVPSRSATLVMLTNRVHPEVADDDFQPVRSAFHRLAFADLDARGAGRRTT